MKATRAAKSDYGEVRRIVAALDRDDAKGALHRGIGNGEDPLGSFFQSHVQRRRDFLERPADPIAIQLGAAA